MGKDGDGFSDLEECIMIFGGSDTIWSKRQHKVCYRGHAPPRRPSPPSSAGQNPRSPLIRGTIPSTSRDRDATRSSLTPSSTRSASPRC